MRLLSLLFAFASFLPAAGYTIAGTVVQHDAKTPVRHAPLAIFYANGSSGPVSVVTGNNGEFSYSGLPAGKYTLRVEVHGQSHLFQENDEFSTAIAIGANLDSEHVVFALPGSATISGAVAEEEGDPVADGQVLLFRRGVELGRQKTRMISQSNTDSAGEFHIRNLTPGTYFVAVQGRPWFSRYTQRTPNETASPLDATYPLTYYADATNPADATPVILVDGSNADLHFAVHAVPAPHVVFEGVPVGAYPQIFTAGPAGTHIPSYGTSTYTTGDGRLELSGMSPGEYMIQFVKDQTPSGRMAVSLVDGAAIDISQARKLSITGTITQPEGHSQLPIVLQNVANGDAGTASFEQDGSFHIEVGPGRYELMMEGEFYMQAVTVKGAGFSRGELDVRDGANIQIAITAAKGLSKVTGVATKDGQPFGGAMILLIPQDFSRGAAIPRDQSDSDGSFSVNSVPPGRYSLLAIEDGRGVAYHDPAVIAPYLKQGQAIEIKPSSSTETKVEVQRQTP